MITLHDIKRIAVNSPLRYFAAPVYNFAVKAELAIASWTIPALLPDSSLDDKLTVVIKTFERPAILRRLIASIRRSYPTLPIIVVDDSRKPTRLPGIETIVMPFNSGVSAGRQAGLDHVRTPFVLILDDDFVFFPNTEIAPAIAKMERNPSIDILGGQLVDIPILRALKPPIGKIFKTQLHPIAPIGSTIDGLLVCDKVVNFYVARTERLRLVGWNAKLRMIDHTDFFTRALGVLVTVFDRELRAFHAQTPFDANYMLHRMDIANDRKLLSARWSNRPEKR